MTPETITYREALACSMRAALASNTSAIVYGLGVTDHTGIFGTTLGLEKEFGAARVFDTPISEDAMTGFAVGASVSGLYPIHIHIRADFLLLAMNQLVNSAAKYRYMYGGKFTAPLLIRAVVGRSWGQGAQHSQSLQAMLAHIPGLTVVMPATAESVLDTYAYAVQKHRGPVVSFEHRILYDCAFKKPASTRRGIKHPFTSRLARKGRDCTVVATSVMVTDALNAAGYLSDRYGIELEVIDLHCLTHPDHAMILNSVRRTGRMIVADTSWSPYGVCADVCRIVATAAPQALKAPVRAISMAHAPCPTAKALENAFYPGAGDIIKAAAELVRHRINPAALPHPDELNRHYLKFKGPF